MNTIGNYVYQGYGLACSKPATAITGTLAVTLIGAAAAAGGMNPAAPKPEVPRILKTNSSVVAHFKHWIVFQDVGHGGLSDKPVSEFIIAFSTAPGASSGELRFAPLARVVVLSENNFLPILNYIHEPESAGPIASAARSSSASAARGSFQVSIFSYLELQEVFYMSPLQSESFFSHLTSLLQKNPNIRADVKKSVADMKSFLSQIKPKK